MKYFSDCHFHALTLAEPNFPALASSLDDTAGNLLLANLTSDYIVTGKLFKDDNLLRTISNTLSVLDRSIGESFLVMEEDLKGSFSRDGRRFLEGGKLHFKGEEYDRVLMLPLVIDFSDSPQKELQTHYSLPPKERLTAYAEATLEGIRTYYKASPDGLFEFYPFIGINPAFHSLEYLVDLLDKYVNTSHREHERHTVPDKPFYGIKLYPPLGFDPWPDEKEEREKALYLYEFCSYYKTPIVTHTDDQGFRGVQAEKAWKYTDPLTWEHVLQRYPSLKIDFAHFGKQYALASLGRPESIAWRRRDLPDSPWFHTITRLMAEYPGVYADLSFSGSEADFYTELWAYLREEDRPELWDRILFGSDFPVNLLKVEAYSEYLTLWEDSPFTAEETDRIAQANALRFLGFNVT